MRHIAPFAQNAERVLATGDPVDDLLGNQRSAGGDLFARTRDKARSSTILVGFGSLGNQRLVFLAGEYGDLAFIGLFETHVHSDCLSVVDFPAVADRGDDDRSLFFNEDYAPVADSKPATRAALQSLYVARSSSRVVD